jgi:hypothetical protein
MKRVRNILNPFMMWGAVLGWLIFGGVGMIRDAWQHRGPGKVFYEQPDRIERVSEDVYKRNHYAGGALLLGLGLYLWMVVAKSATKDESATIQSRE